MSTQNQTLQIMKVVVDTTVDGPGWRTSIYCAGCRHACHNCHNPETWDFRAGHTVSLDELFEEISITEGNITFTGGDPMFQPAAFTQLAQRIRQELGRTIWCYTGFTYEQVVADAEMSKMLPYLEVLVDGPFIDAQRTLDLCFRGSHNQRLIDVQASLAAGHAVEFYYDPYPKF